MLSWRRSSTRHPPSTKCATDASDAWETLRLVNDWVKHAEVKAGATLTAAGVVGGTLWNLVSNHVYNALIYRTSAVMCAVFALAAAGLCLWALKPRLKSQEAPTNALYFSHIARQHPQHPADYIKELRRLAIDPEEMTIHLGHQIWANAHVASRKYYWTHLGMYALAVSLAGLAGTAFYTALVSIGAVDGQ